MTFSTTEAIREASEMRSYQGIPLPTYSGGVEYGFDLFTGQPIASVNSGGMGAYYQRFPQYPMGGPLVSAYGSSASQTFGEAIDAQLLSEAEYQTTYPNKYYEAVDPDELRLEGSFVSGGFQPAARVPPDATIEPVFQSTFQVPMAINQLSGSSDMQSSRNVDFTSAYSSGSSGRSVRTKFQPDSSKTEVSAFQTSFTGHSQITVKILNRNSYMDQLCIPI